MTVPAPVLTVCIPTYRYGRYISQAIESILSQDFTDYELLIVDDASPDDTRDVVERYAAMDSRIIFEVNDENRGMVPNWNYCLEKARGRYIKFLFADDFLCSSFALRQMVEQLDKTPGISLVFSARRLVDESGNDMRIASPFGNAVRRIGGVKLTGYCMARMNNPIGEPSTVMFRKEQGVRGFDPRYRQLVDLEMWLHLLRQGDAAYLPEPLCAFRMHPSQQTTVNVRFLQDDRLFLLDGYLPDDGMLKAYLEYCQYYAFWKTARRGTAWEQESAAGRIAARYQPWQFRMLLPAYKILTPLYKLLTPILYRA